jgi:hypothetical protein
MTDIRTVLRVEFVIRSPAGGAERHIVAWVERLPDSHPDDACRGLETFRLSIQDDAKGDKPDESKWVLSSLNFLKYHLTRELHQILNAVDYGSGKTALEVVEIVEDTHGIIEHHFCHCQYCGSIFLEHFGYLGVAIKKCKCGRLTVCCDEFGRPIRV